MQRRAQNWSSLIKFDSMVLNLDLVQSCGAWWVCLSAHWIPLAARSLAICKQRCASCRIPKCASIAGLCGLCNCEMLWFTVSTGWTKAWQVARWKEQPRGFPSMVRLVTSTVAKYELTWNSSNHGPRFSYFWRGKVSSSHWTSSRASFRVAWLSVALDSFYFISNEKSHQLVWLGRKVHQPAVHSRPNYLPFSHR